MPEKLSGVRRKDQGFCAVRGFQEGQVVERVKAATRRIAIERITLNPDCGFSPGSGAPVDMDEVYEKLKVEVAAARILRQEFA